MSILRISAQISFSNGSSRLANPWIRSGISVGIADLNGDFKDDLIRMHEGTDLYIEFQNQSTQSFSSFSFGAVSTTAEWSMCAGDVDRNGFNDILIGGEYTDIKILRNDMGNSLAMNTLNDSNIFVQGSNFCDINNDGWLDIFACHDDGDPRKYRNLTDGTFVFDQSLISTNIGSGNSGNYASIWIDYDNDQDLDMYLSKCRAGVTDPNDPRRLNRLFRNDGQNNFQDVAHFAGLQIGAQTWCSTFEDIDNDGDLDCFMINHGSQSLMYENNGDGTFSNITNASNLSGKISFSAYQTIMRDFDNDGYVDLLVSGSQERLYRNNGNKFFIEISDPFGERILRTFAVGDLNRDGYLDVYAAYPNLINNPHIFADEIWLNDGGSNNFFVAELKGTESNINGIGARVELHYSGGIQIREVRSGESYGIQNTFNQHFGLGTATSIDSVVVRWPSGIKDVVEDPDINQFYRINEGEYRFCEEEIIIVTDPIPSLLFKARNLIQASTTIPSKNHVIFESGEIIQLMPEFIIENRGILEAWIKECAEN